MKKFALKDFYFYFFLFCIFGIGNGFELRILGRIEKGY